MRLGRAQHFKPQVKKVLLTGTVIGGTGSSAGTILAADFVSISTSAQVGSSVGTTPTADFFSAQSSIFTITGAAVVTGAGLSFDAEIAASAGVAAVAGVGKLTTAQVASASGTSTGAWISQPVVTNSGIGSSPGQTSIALGIAAPGGRNLDGGGGHSGQTRTRPYGWWKSPKHNPAIRAKKPLDEEERKTIEEVARDPFDKTIAELLAPYQTPKGIDWGEAESEQATNALRQGLQQHMQDLQDEADDEDALLELAF